MAIVFVGAASSSIDGAILSVDISAIPIEPGDLALALVAYGDPDAPPAGTPAGWARLTGAPIQSPGTLAGEALGRFLGGLEQTFEFRAEEGGAIAAAIAIWRGARGIDTLFAAAESSEAVPTKFHPTPGAEVRDPGSLAASLHLFWFPPAAIAPAVGTTLRAAEVAAGQVAVAIASELTNPFPGAVPRSLVTNNTGTSSSLTAIITPATGQRSPWEIEHGDRQGLVDGALELGHAEPGRMVSLEIGDRRRVFQAGELPGDILEVDVWLRPAVAPAGSEWIVRLDIDGTTAASVMVDRAGMITLAANVADLAGEHEVAVILELAAA